uniref:Uncharacterized protein n=1 Tax=Populus davidiana TaxID=266767 RepID=A0A6M2ECF2_9ROSI
MDHQHLHRQPPAPPPSTTILATVQQQQQVPPPDQIVAFVRTQTTGSKPHGPFFASASAVTSTASQGMRSSCRKVRPTLSFKSSRPVEIYLHLKQNKKANPNSSWF